MACSARPIVIIVRVSSYLKLLKLIAHTQKKIKIKKIWNPASELRTKLLISASLPFIESSGSLLFHHGEGTV